MKKGKGKKNQNPTFKITPKIELEENQIQEYQIKKKILEEKYCTLYIYLYYYSDNKISMRKDKARPTRIQTTTNGYEKYKRF